MNTKQKQKLMTMQLGKKQKTYPTKAKKNDKYMIKQLFLREINEIMEHCDYFTVGAPERNPVPLH